MLASAATRATAPACSFLALACSRVAHFAASMAASSLRSASGSALEARSRASAFHLSSFADLV
eukprot:1733386-Pyramimonas_sp.AAC.1